MRSGGKSLTLVLAYLISGLEKSSPFYLSVVIAATENCFSLQSPSTCHGFNWSKFRSRVDSLVQDT